MTTEYLWSRYSSGKANFRSVCKRLGEVAVPSYLAVLCCTSSGSGWTSRHSVLVQAMAGSRAPSWLVLHLKEKFDMVSLHWDWRTRKGHKLVPNTTLEKKKWPYWKNNHNLPILSLLKEAVKRRLPHNRHIYKRKRHGLINSGCDKVTNNNILKHQLSKNRYKGRSIYQMHLCEQAS